MAKLKLPNIKAHIASEVKPMNTMVKSITSKLKAKAPKAAKVKGMSGSIKMSGADLPKTPSMKLPSFMTKK